MGKYYRIILLSLLCWFIHLNMVGAEPYRVVVNSTLNVRPAPNMVSPAIGTLNNNEQIEVAEIKKGWAQIEYKGRKGYVHCKYIVPASQTKATTPVTSTPQERFIVLSIVGLCAISLIIRRIKKGESLTGIYHIINLASLLAIFGLELYYFFGIGGDIWFCYPERVGWLKTVIHFFVFGAIVFYQIRSYFATLVEIQENIKQKINYCIGKYSVIALVLLAIISLIYEMNIEGYIAIAFVVAQLIQMGLILWAHGKHFFYGIINVIFYLAGAVATLWVIANFLFLLAIVVIAIFALQMIGSTANNPPSKEEYY